MNALIIFLGAGLGGVCRHGVNLGAARLLGPGFPFGTLTVNIVGSFLMGVLAGYFALKGEAGQPWRLFLATGILGGFTTFSAFALDAALLWERGAMVSLLVYTLGSVLLSILALFAGLALIRTLP